MKSVKGDHQGCQKYIRSPYLSLHDTFLERILKNLEGSEFSLRSESLHSWRINSPLFVEPVASLLSSRESATCPYSEPNKSAPASSHHIYLVHFNIVLPHTSMSFTKSLSFRFSGHSTKSDL
jgi:hypothetical protein